MSIFFTADRHHGHSNILWLCKRPFKSIYEHDQALINNHNSIVSDNDTVYHLGDWSYKCSPHYSVECLKKSNGRFKMVLGNHEKPIRQAYEMGLLNELLNNGKLEVIGGVEILKDKDLYVSKVIYINNYRMFIGHNASRSWPHAFRGAIHLFGHSHGRLGMFYKSMDVGVDAVDNKYFPISFDDVIKKVANAEDFKEDFKEDGKGKYEQRNNG